jgi:hypothetical protein
VEVALAPEELELDPMAMTQKYEEHVREQQAQVEKEDFSDMVAEHAAKQKVGATCGPRRRAVLSGGGRGGWTRCLKVSEMLHWWQSLKFRKRKEVI